MTIEVLFPKLCNLAGDIKNMTYFRLCLPEADFIETEITADKPWFLDHNVDMVYMGSMSEKVQSRVIAWLRPYKSRIEEMIEAGTVFLFTGNAYEVMTQKIENVTTGETVEGLGLFPLTTRIDFFDRYNGKVLAKLQDFEIVGFRSHFSMVYGDNSQEPFLSCQRGVGINKKSSFEGVRRKNFIGTHLTGPLLVLNPLFTEYLMGLLGVENPRAALREETMAAYERRLADFQDPKTGF